MGHYWSLQVVHLPCLEKGSRKVSHLLTAEEKFQPSYPSIGWVVQEESERNSDEYHRVIYHDGDKACRCAFLHRSNDTFSGRADVSSDKGKGGSE